MGTITVILTSIGSLIGLTKNFLELRSTIIGLFKKDIQLNSAFSDLSKKDEKVLRDLYKAIETGQDLSNRLYKKLAIKYLSTLIMFILILVGGIIILQSFKFSSSFIFRSFEIVAGPVIAYILVTKLFPNPFKFNFAYLDNIFGLSKHYLTQQIIDLQYNDYPRIYQIRRVMGFINLMNPNEEKYLKHYLDLCSLRDTLEIYWIDKMVEEAKTYIFETMIFKTAIEKIISENIVDFVKEKKDVSANKNEIENIIKRDGLERFLKIFDDNFFRRDFANAYRADPQNGVLNIIREYW